MSEEKNGLGGRPPVYTKWLTEKNLKKITAWSAKGLTNQQIADNIGVSVTSWYEWKSRFPEFVKAMENGKEDSIQHVVGALLKNATGSQVLSEKKKVLMPYPEEKRSKMVRKALLEKSEELGRELTLDEELKVEENVPHGVMVEVEEKLREQKPDTAAQIFFLKNRAPELWSDKRIIEGQGELNTGNPLAGLSTEELMRIALTPRLQDKPQQVSKIQEINEGSGK